MNSNLFQFKLIFSKFLLTPLIKQLIQNICIKKIQIFFLLKHQIFPFTRVIINPTHTRRVNSIRFVTLVFSVTEALHVSFNPNHRETIRTCGKKYQIHMTKSSSSRFVPHPRYRSQKRLHNNMIEKKQRREAKRTKNRNGVSIGTLQKLNHDRRELSRFVRHARKDVVQLIYYIRSDHVHKTLLLRVTDFWKKDQKR